MSIHRRSGLLEDLFELAASIGDRQHLEREYAEYISSPETSNVALDEFLVIKIVEAEEKYFLFENLNVATRLLEDHELQRVSRQKFLKYAPALGLLDPVIAPKFFDHLDQEGKGSIPSSLFVEFITTLRKTYEPSLKWIELKDRLGLPKGEILLKHSSYVANTTDDLIGPTGSLYLSCNYLYFESPALNRQQLIPISAISAITKKRSGFIRNDNVIELAGDAANTRPISFAFHRGRDRWFEYIKDIIDLQTMEKDIVDSFRSCLIHNNHLSRALYSLTMKFPTFMHAHTTSGGYRGALQHGLKTQFLSRFPLIYDKIAATVEIPYIDEQALMGSYKPFEYQSLVDGLTTTLQYASPLFVLSHHIQNILTWKSTSTTILAIIVSIFFVYIDIFDYTYYMFVLCNVAFMFIAPTIAFMSRFKGAAHKENTNTINKKRSMSSSKRGTGDATIDQQEESIATQPAEVEEKYTNQASIFSLLAIIQGATAAVNRISGKLKSIYTWQDPTMTHAYIIASSCFLLLCKFLPSKLLGCFIIILVFSANYAVGKDSLVRPSIDFMLQKWHAIPVSAAK